MKTNTKGSIIYQMFVGLLKTLVNILNTKDTNLLLSMMLSLQVETKSICTYMHIYVCVFVCVSVCFSIV